MNHYSPFSFLSVILPPSTHSNSSSHCGLRLLLKTVLTAFPRQKQAGVRDIRWRRWFINSLINVIIRLKERPFTRPIDVSDRQVKVIEYVDFGYRARQRDIRAHAENVFVQMRQKWGIVNVVSVKRAVFSETRVHRYVGEAYIYAVITAICRKISKYVFFTCKRVGDTIGMPLR